MQIDKQTIRTMRDELNALLMDWATKNNVSVEVGSASYLPGQNVTFKLCVANKVKTAAGEVVMDKEAVDFRQSARLFGLEPSDLNRRFMFRGQGYTITGSSARAWKAPILATRDDGKKFKFPAPTVCMALDKKVKPQGDMMTIGQNDVGTLPEGI